MVHPFNTKDEQKLQMDANGKTPKSSQYSKSFHFSLHELMYWHGFSVRNDAILKTPGQDGARGDQLHSWSLFPGTRFTGGSSHYSANCKT